jgi:hypothetical protein
MVKMLSLNLSFSNKQSEFAIVDALLSSSSSTIDQQLIDAACAALQQHGSQPIIAQQFEKMVAD